MRANLILSKNLTLEEDEIIRKAFKQLQIEIVTEETDEELPKIKIVAKQAIEFPLNTTPECLTITVNCLKQILSIDEIKSPFDLKRDGLFFANLYLYKNYIGFGAIPSEDIHRLTQYIAFMGGKIVSLDDSRINFIISNEMCANPNNAQIVLSSWIDALFLAPQKIDPSRFVLDYISGPPSSQNNPAEIDFASKTQEVQSSSKKTLQQANCDALNQNKTNTTPGRSSSTMPNVSNSQPALQSNRRNQRAIKSMIKPKTRKLNLQIDPKQLLLPFSPTSSSSVSASSSANPVLMTSPSTQSPSSTQKPFSNALNGNSNLKNRPRSKARSNLKCDDTHSQKIDSFVVPASKLSKSDSNNTSTNSSDYIASLTEDSQQNKNVNPRVQSSCCPHPSQLNIVVEEIPSNINSVSMNQTPKSSTDLRCLKDFSKLAANKNKNNSNNDQKGKDKSVVLKTLSAHTPILEVMVEDTQISSDDMSDDGNLGTTCQSPSRARRLNAACSVLTRNTPSNPNFVLNTESEVIIPQAPPGPSYDVNDISDFNRFSQCETCESQSVYQYFNVDYERENKPEESQASGAPDKDLLECLELLKRANND